MLYHQCAMCFCMSKSTFTVGPSSKCVLKCVRLLQCFKNKVPHLRYEVRKSLGSLERRAKERAVRERKLKILKVHACVCGS